MKLVIDIGNTRAKLALFSGKDLVEKSDVTFCTLKNIQNFVLGKKISSCIICSVREIDSEISSILNNYNGFILSESIPVPITNHYKTPSTLGQDRLAAIVGAYFLYPEKDIIVFDAGTCLTIDFLNKNGEYIGGRISPGIEIRFRALHTFTDKLPLLHKQNHAPNLGNDTNSSILSGVLEGILAEVRSVISDFRLQKPDLVAVVTGGDCFFFEKELKSSIFANSNLVMIGLNEILDFNA